MPAPCSERAFPVRHWGARLQKDTYRGYNGYVLERNGHAIIFGGDSAMTDTFAALRQRRRFDLAIMAIGGYDPWIRAHSTPEEAVTNGECRRRRLHHAGAPSNIPLERGTISRADRKI